MKRDKFEYNQRYSSFFECMQRVSRQKCLAKQRTCKLELTKFEFSFATKQNKRTKLKLKIICIVFVFQFTKVVSVVSQQQPHLLRQTQRQFVALIY